MNLNVRIACFICCGSRWSGGRPSSLAVMAPRWPSISRRGQGGSAQVAAVASVGAKLSERYGQARVPQVRLLPTQVGRASLPAPRSALESVLGLEDRLLQAAVVDLSEGHFLVAGPTRSGRTTAL